MEQRHTDEARELEGASYRELRALEEVESSPELSQRRLALRLGVALGVANLLVRSLVKKGYVRATRAGWRRWAYSLTPAGLTRKAQLTLAYADRFLDHYRRVRALLRDDLGALPMSPDSRVAVYGTDELAELVYLVLSNLGISQIDFYDREGAGLKFLGTTVRTMESFDPEEYAKVIVASSVQVEARTAELLGVGVSPNQIVTLLQNARRGKSQGSSRQAAGDGGKSTPEEV